MGDSAQFRYGKKATDAGLEFVGSKKKSLFSQYTAQFKQPTPTENTMQSNTPAASSVQHVPPQPVQQTVYQDQPPVIITHPEPALAPDTMQSLFDDEDSSVIMADIPKSHISRPQLKYQKTNNNDESQGGKKPSKVKRIFAGIGVVAALVIIGVSTLFILHTRPAVPASLKAEAGFPIYEMMPNSFFSLDKKSVEINNNGSLVYILYQKDNKAKFIISQQSVPEVIKQDAQYQQFLAETDKFASFDSKIGKAYFTRPANLGEDISVVVKTDTTLLFIRGNGTTAEEDWVELLSVIDVVK